MFNKDEEWEIAHAMNACDKARCHAMNLISARSENMNLDTLRFLREARSAIRSALASLAAARKSENG